RHVDRQGDFADQFWIVCDRQAKRQEEGAARRVHEDRIGLRPGTFQGEEDRLRVLAVGRRSVAQDRRVEVQHRAGRDPNVGVVGPYVRRDETNPERKGPRRCVPQGGDGEVLRLAAREGPRRREGIRRAVGTRDPEGDLVLDGKWEGGRGQQGGRGGDTRDEGGGA